MFSLLHEYLITDLNTEKKTKSTWYCQKKINYILENLFVQDMHSYVIFELCLFHIPVPTKVVLKGVSYLNVHKLE